METKNLSIYQEIDILNTNKTFFKATIRKIYDKYFIVEADIKQKDYHDVNTNRYVEYFSAADDKAYRCKSLILGTRTSGSSQFIILSKPKILTQIERRQFIRIPIILETNYCFLEREKAIDFSLKNLPQDYLKKFKKTFTTDLSGGGINIITYEDSQASDFILLRFFLTEQITALCSVVRNEVDKENNNFHTALRFKDINELHRKIIIDFIKAKLNASDNE